MKNLAVKILIWTSLFLGAYAKPGGDYSCHHHEGQKKCAGKKTSLGHMALRTCRGGLWRATRCPYGCYILPEPHCRSKETMYPPNVAAVPVVEDQMNETEN